jgi:hypothetical protein
LVLPQGTLIDVVLLTELVMVSIIVVIVKGRIKVITVEAASLLVEESAPASAGAEAGAEMGSTVAAGGAAATAAAAAAAR